MEQLHSFRQIQLTAALAKNWWHLKLSIAVSSHDNEMGLSRVSDSPVSRNQWRSHSSLNRAGNRWCGTDLGLVFFFFWAYEMCFLFFTKRKLLSVTAGVCLLCLGTQFCHFFCFSPSLPVGLKGLIAGWRTLLLCCTLEWPWKRKATSNHYLCPQGSFCFFFLFFFNVCLLMLP